MKLLKIWAYGMSMYAVGLLIGHYDPEPVFLYGFIAGVPMMWFAIVLSRQA